MTHQGKTPEPLSPVGQAARLDWNERWLIHRSVARTWRVIAITATVVAGGCVLIAMHQAEQSKVVPFVVEVDKLGETVAARQIEQTDPTDVRIIKAQLAEWVMDMRSVLADPQAQVQWFRRGYAWIDSRGPAARTFAEWFSANTARERATDATIQVEIETVSPEGGSSWRINWREQRFNLKGEKDGPPSSWYAVVSVKFNPPTTDAAIIANPIGLYIETLVWGDRPAGVQ